MDNKENTFFILKKWKIEEFSMKQTKHALMFITIFLSFSGMLFTGCLKKKEDQPAPKEEVVKSPVKLGKLQKINVSASSKVVHLGNKITFKAVGVFSSQKKKDITPSVKWKVHPRGVLTFEKNNRTAKTKNVDKNIRVTAVKDGVEGSVSIDIEEAALMGIRIQFGESGKDQSITLGEEKKLRVMGEFSNRDDNISNAVDWKYQGRNIQDDNDLFQIDRINETIKFKKLPGGSGKVKLTAYWTTKKAGKDREQDIEFTVTDPKVESVSITTADKKINIPAGMRVEVKINLHLENSSVISPRKDRGEVVELGLKHDLLGKWQLDKIIKLVKENNKYWLVVDPNPTVKDLKDVEIYVKNHTIPHKVEAGQFQIKPSLKINVIPAVIEKIRIVADNRYPTDYKGFKLQAFAVWTDKRQDDDITAKAVWSTNDNSIMKCASGTCSTSKVPGKVTVEVTYVSTNNSKHSGSVDIEVFPTKKKEIIISTRSHDKDNRVGRYKNYPIYLEYLCDNGKKYPVEDPGKINLRYSQDDKIRIFYQDKKWWIYGKELSKDVVATATHKDLRITGQATFKVVRIEVWVVLDRTFNSRHKLYDNARRLLFRIYKIIRKKMKEQEFSLRVSFHKGHDKKIEDVKLKKIKETSSIVGWNKGVKHTIKTNSDPIHFDERLFKYRTVETHLFVLTWFPFANRLGTPTVNKKRKKILTLQKTNNVTPHWMFFVSKNHVISEEEIKDIYKDKRMVESHVFVRNKRDEDKPKLRNWLIETIEEIIPHNVLLENEKGELSEISVTKSKGKYDIYGDFDPAGKSYKLYKKGYQEAEVNSKNDITLTPINQDETECWVVLDVTFMYDKPYKKALEVFSKIYRLTKRNKKHFGCIKVKGALIVQDNDDQKLIFKEYHEISNYSEPRQGRNLWAGYNEDLFKQSKKKVILILLTYIDHKHIIRNSHKSNKLRVKTEQWLKHTNVDPWWIVFPKSKSHEGKISNLYNISGLEKRSCVMVQEDNFKEMIDKLKKLFKGKLKKMPEELR